MTSGALKRCFDVLVSLVALIALAVPMVIVALLVRVNMGSPVLFRQQRPGLGGRPFKIVKFRTMRTEKSDDIEHHDIQRITGLGRFLRASSLDEPPQLWNVLKGEMSLVGPRPLLMEYLPLYSAEQMRRHEVKPGVTGWAQVNGRNAISWEEKFALDTWYVDNRNFLLDLKILFMTALVIVRPKGVVSAGTMNTTMPTFKGTPPGGLDQLAGPR
jgi:lipopolysaccharide/colanic/teichoic acid biosynthesis glycosyltransferase